MGGLYPVQNEEKPWDIIEDLMELDVNAQMDNLQHINRKNKNVLEIFHAWPTAFNAN